jgi:hypothetical protein
MTFDFPPLKLDENLFLFIVRLNVAFGHFRVSPLGHSPHTRRPPAPYHAVKVQQDNSRRTFIAIGSY